MYSLKSILKESLFVLFILLGSFYLNAQNGYDIKVRIENYTGNDVILGYRLGSKSYIVKNIKKKDEKGFFNFKGDKPLKGGVYFIFVKPTEDFFEFLIANNNEQHLTISTTLKKGKLNENLKIEGSEENSTYLEYMSFLSKKRGRAESLRKRKKELDNILDDQGNHYLTSSQKRELKSVSEELNNLSSKIKEYQNESIQQYPNYLISSLLKSSFTPEIPKSLEKQEEKINYYKKHFWDSFNWSDERLIRSTIFEEKITTYLDKLTRNSPEEQIISSDFILEKVLNANNKDVYQYVVSTLLNKYAKSKIVCMDKAYVHIGSKYYCGLEKPDWVNREDLAKICKNVNALKNTLCGEKATPFKLKNIIDSSIVDLNNIDKKFTLLYFWNPDNDLNQTKELIRVYNRWKGSDFEIIAISFGDLKQISKWKSTIKNLNTTWINASGLRSTMSKFLEHYNIDKSFKIYLLNENKEFILKRVSAKQVDNYLKRNLK